jgi:SAM-dependent methyltransferase
MDNFLINSIKKRGFVATFLVVIYELFFMVKYPVEMSRAIDLGTLKVQGGHKKYGENYQGVNYYYFRKIFSTVKWKYQSSVFVDFGSGKGKALLMANEFGFSKLIGVEFAQKLVEQSQKNLNKFKVRAEIIYEDASTFSIPDEANVFFFFNPFARPVMTKVLQNIVKSLEKNKQKVLIFYFNPKLGEVVLSQGFKILREIKNKNKIEVQVYTN